MRLLWALGLTLVGSAAAAQPIEVPLCELTAHAAKYHSQLVSVEAKFHLDEWILYHSECPGRDHWIALEDAVDSESRLTEGIPGPLSGVVEGKFVGRFQGPNGFGYSNLGRLRTELQVLEIAEVHRVRGAEDPGSDAPAPLLEARETIELLSSRWLAAIQGRDEDELRKVLSEDYIAILPDGELLAGRQAMETLVLPHQQAIDALTDEGRAPETFETRHRIFLLDSQTAVSILQVSLGGFARTNSDWAYTNVYRQVDSRWYLVLSRMSRTGAAQTPDW